jgi:hypothetical protein
MSLFRKIIDLRSPLGRAAFFRTAGRIRCLFLPIQCLEQWGGVMPANYFANAQAAYNGTLERIMEQKFFALFFVDYQQWFEHNRTGLPVMPRGDGVPSGNVMPKRLLYPAVLQRTNLKNYQEAKAVMGGDELSTKLMWQK